ncbi:DUF4019 domain-containing protein [Sphingomonas sp.]|uniref:helix-turn-helix domain-containing protein n=1 Tax=Sphingomonas sp. TaxID=28214 RepID=UPI0031D4210B
MTMRDKHGIAALTDKEKQTLRLIVRGHDAKSIAQNLDLSVHTINERLRDARRKLAVSSSREAARLLLDAEGGVSLPENVGDRRIGEDRSPASADDGPAPIVGATGGVRRPLILMGATLMTFALGLLALAGLTHMTPPAQMTASTSTVPPDPAVVDAAQRFLALVDQGRWADSYRATGSAFRKLNTEPVWAAASEKARTPLGKLVSRTFLSQDDIPAPPAGYQMVRFRTRFESSADVIETVTLERERGEWRITGITIG